MIQELDTVSLTHDIEEHNLKQGDVGTIVHCYGDYKTEENVAFEVEFVNAEGRTLALLTLNPNDIRPAQAPGEYRVPRMSTFLLIGLDPRVLEVATLAIRLRWPDVEPVIATSAKEGLERIKLDSPDLVLIHPDFVDLTLEETIQRMRRFTAVPVLILGRVRDIREVVTALASGADDYVGLPADLTEIMVRMWALLRRVGVLPVNNSEGPLSSGGLFINPATYEVFLEQRLVTLTSTEFRLLYLLVKNRGTVVPRQTLERALWGEQVDSGRLVDKYVQRLRRKLGDDAREPSWIASVPGVGYRFIGPLPQPQETERSIGSNAGR